MVECERLHIVSGFVYGLRQPALRMRLRFDPAHLEGALESLQHPLQVLPEHITIGCQVAGVPDSTVCVLSRFCERLLRLQITAGLPVYAGAVIERLTRLSGADQRFQVVLLIASPYPILLSRVIKPLVSHLNASVVADSPVPGWLALLGTHAPSGVNTLHLIRSAAHLRMPVQFLPAGVVQIGWGRLARLFKSSITDMTPSIGVGWAKDKRASQTLLRMAGMPVPRQAHVTTLASALEAAEQIGYPVVLKPARLDRGVGVEAGLRHAEDVRLAYQRSSACASDLVLEQHITGEDYRIYVVNGQCVGVAHRIPAHVMGNGQSTVQDLVAESNRLRSDPSATASVYKPITLDAEALDLLARDGLSIHSVPSLGQRVLLCRSANSSRGGTSRDVTPDIHPDNAELAVRAAALLRLDIAGLDFLSPDISRSWREVGGGFCEVNAQPQMGGAQPWIFDRILRRLVKGRGRVPTVLVCSDVPDQTGRSVADHMGRAGYPARVVSGLPTTLHDQALATVIDPGCEGVVVYTRFRDLDVVGLPLDHFDVWVLCMETAPEPASFNTLSAVLPHVDEVVVCAPVADQVIPSLQARTPEYLRVCGTPDVTQIPDLVIERLMHIHR